MKKIVTSLALITMIGSALAFGATKAFFSDTETSTANTFTAGAIDLKVDNESYYNGLISNATSWSLKDLTIEKFFNFLDLKPDDYGEDTVSLHVETNDAYLCANITLKTNNENGQTEPEALVDTTTGATQGELAGLVNFMWWADDGDNVFESDEHVISKGPIGGLPLGQPYYLSLADYNQNMWTGQSGPIPGMTTKYLGKAWCFGTMGTAPVAQDGGDKGRSPAGNNNGNTVSGEPEDGGFTCDGTALGNESQTDSLTADVTFEAVQARNNPTFNCKEQVACTPSTSNIFVNGGFEDPVVVSGDKWEVFAAAVTGWTIAWRNDVPLSYNSVIRPEPGNLELHRGVLGVAHGGEQYAELDSDWDGHANTVSGEPASTVISQTFPTVVGATYAVDYWFAPRPNTDANNNKVVARWNGVVIDTVGPLAGGGSNLTSGDWIHRVPVVIVATSTSATISFTDDGTADSLGSFIDDVTVLQTTCPN